MWFDLKQSSRVLATIPIAVAIALLSAPGSRCADGDISLSAKAPSDVMVTGPVCEVARQRVVPEGAPRASDVIMRALTLRAATGQTPETSRDTFQALADFHVTRLEWAYIQDRAFIAKVRSSGRTFGGAASSALTHVLKPQPTDYGDLACVDLNGSPVVPTWKRAWKPPGNLWLCVNNPEAEAAYVRYLQAVVDAGAQIVQRDEPGGNVNSLAWGGCFCDHCMSKFRTFLARETTVEQRQRWGVEPLDKFDYRVVLRRDKAPVGDAFAGWSGGELKQLFVRFQAETTEAFHRRTRAALDQHAGRRVAMSCNNGCRLRGPIEQDFDWWFGELSYRHAGPAGIWDMMRQTERMDRMQVITMPKKADREQLDEWCRLTRRTIAMAYACGGHAMVPWDVYMPNDAPRYFGTAEQYSDLYGFIRAVAPYLDGYQYAGAVGAEIDCPLVGDDPPLQVAGTKDVYALVRAVPGQADAPVVIHLVDWSDTPRPLQVLLNPTRLFGQRPVTVTLLTPVPYSRADHEQAERTGAYPVLRRETVLASGYVPCVTVPALDPWGMLVIAPSEPSEPGIWPPTILPVGGSRYRPTLELTMRTATPGTVIHYTTDGSDPTAGSVRFGAPIPVTAEAVIKAVAVRDDGRMSGVTVTECTRARDLPQAARPDDGPGQDRLRLWLKADTLRLADGAAVREWPSVVGLAAVAVPRTAVDGTPLQPPTFVAAALGGKPVVRFDGIDDSLVVRDFANQFLAGQAFTLFLVTRSPHDEFGVCGNGLGGSGGIPRLYMQRTGFRYNGLDRCVPLAADGSRPVITVYMHDGRQTISAASNGSAAAALTDCPVVPKFGGGHLAMPFWSGNRNRAGEIAELIALEGQLTDDQRHGIEMYLAVKYGIPCWECWTVRVVSR